MRVAIFDVDGTITSRTTEVVFVRYLMKKRQVSLKYILPTMVLHLLRHAREGRGFYRTYKAYLKNKRIESVDALIKDCFQQEIIPLIAEEARREIAMHKKQKRKIVLLSGSIYPVIYELKRYLGADYALSTKVLVKQDRYTSKVKGTVPYGIDKVRIFREFFKDKNINLHDSYAYGNHDSDAHILGLVGHPVAVNPTKKLKKHARQCDWKVEYWH